MLPINVQWFSTPLSASINFKCVLAYISINIYHLPFLFVVQKNHIPTLVHHVLLSVESYPCFLAATPTCAILLHRSIYPAKVRGPERQCYPCQENGHVEKVLKPTKIVDRWDDKQIAGKHCISEPISSRFP